MKYFWEYPITGDTARHATRKGGPATDYATPTGTKLHMPILGRVYPYTHPDMGNAVYIEGTKYRIYIGHMRNASVKSGTLRGWRTTFGYSGATGKATGPHVHAYVIIKKTGKRVSFTEWLRDYVHKGKPSRLPDATRRFLGIK